MEKILMSQTEVKYKWENIIGIMSVICSLFVMINSFLNPKDMVVLSFISWALLSLSAGFALLFDGKNGWMYFIFGGADIITAGVAFFGGAPVGIDDINVLSFFIVILCISTVIMIKGKNFPKMSAIVTAVITLISFYFTLIYYLETGHTASSFYCWTIVLAQVILVLQLWKNENFFSNLQEKSFKKCISSFSTLIWTTGNALALLVMWGKRFLKMPVKFGIFILQKFRKTL